MRYTIIAAPDPY